MGVSRFWAPRFGVRVGVSSVLASANEGNPKNDGCLERFGLRKRRTSKKRWVSRAFWPLQQREIQKTMGVSSVLASAKGGNPKNDGCVERFGLCNRGKSKKKDIQKTMGVSSVLASATEGNPKNDGCLERFGLCKRRKSKKRLVSRAFWPLHQREIQKTVGVSSVLASAKEGKPKNDGCLERFGPRTNGKSKRRWVSRAFWPLHSRESQKNDGCLERFGPRTKGKSKKQWVSRAFWPPHKREIQKTVGVSSVLASARQGNPRNGGCLERFGLRTKGKSKKRWVSRAFWPLRKREIQKTVGVSSVLASGDKGWAPKRRVRRGGYLERFGSHYLDLVKEAVTLGPAHKQPYLTNFKLVFLGNCSTEAKLKTIFVFVSLTPLSNIIVCFNQRNQINICRKCVPFSSLTFPTAEGWRQGRLRH